MIVRGGRSPPPAPTNARQVNEMYHEQLMGVQKPDMNELREVKVKIPVRQLLRLHYLKLTTSRTFSDVVAEALGDYFTHAVPDRAGAE